MKKTSDTKARILTAAKAIYKKKGYTASTFAMIEKESGISRSLINYYFPKKQDILVCLLKKHLDSMIDYVRCHGDYGSILVYMLSVALYNKSMHITPDTARFHMDVLFRTDRDTGPYRNYDDLYKNIIIEYNIDLSDEKIYLKEIAAFGAMIEMQASYLKGNLKLSFLELQEEIFCNTLSIFKIPYLVINNNLEVFRKEFEILSVKKFDFFNS